MMIVFFGKGENDRVRLRGLLFVCKRGCCDMLALALSHTYTELVI